MLSIRAAHKNVAALVSRETLITLYFLYQNPEQSQSPARLQPRGSGSIRQEEDHGQAEQQHGRLRQVRGELILLTSYVPDPLSPNPETRRLRLSLESHAHPANKIDQVDSEIKDMG